MEQDYCELSLFDRLMGRTTKVTRATTHHWEEYKRLLKNAEKAEDDGDTNAAERLLGIAVYHYELWLG